MLIQRKRRPLRSARGQCGSSHQARQHFVLHDAFVEQRPEEWYFRLSRDLYSIQFVLQRVNNYQDVAEFRRYDISAVVTPVLRPDNVDLIVAKVSRLKSSTL